MYNLDTLILLQVSLATGMTLWICTSLLKNRRARLYLWFGVVALFLYAGIGAAWEGTHRDYPFYYCIFVAMLAGTFTLVVKLAPRSRKRAEYLRPLQAIIERPLFPQVVLAAYLACDLISLTVPEFRLHRIVAPPAPDLRQLFFEMFETEKHPIHYWMQFLQNLMLPLFLLALYSLRRQRLWVSLAVAAPLYLQYCLDAYIGRYVVAQHLVFLFLLFWTSEETTRKHKIVLASAGAALVLVLLPLFSAYTTLRLGVHQEVEFGDGVYEAVEDLFWDETSYPLHSPAVFDGDRRVDKVQYLGWIITLPIPKAFIGSGTSIYLNNEITEVVMGSRVGFGGSHVVLTSLVNESVYLFGRNLFWLHACFIGLVFGLVFRLLSRSPAFLPVLLYTSILFGVMARGGIASVLPVLINQYLPLYLLVFYFVVVRPRTSLPVPSLTLSQA